MQPQRRSYSKSFKAQVIQECAQPGASIASIALGHSLNANLVHKWIRVQAQKNTSLQTAFIPLPMQTTAHRSSSQSNGRRYRQRLKTRENVTLKAICTRPYGHELRMDNSSKLVHIQPYDHTGSHQLFQPVTGLNRPEVAVRCV